MPVYAFQSYSQEAISFAGEEIDSDDPSLRLIPAKHSIEHYCQIQISPYACLSQSIFTANISAEPHNKPVWWVFLSSLFTDEESKAKRG